MFTIFKKKSVYHADGSSGSESVPLACKTPQGSGPDVVNIRQKAAQEARPLQRSWLSLAVDIVLALLPLVFLGLLIASAWQDKRPQSVTGDRIQDALLLSPTIFPLYLQLYAARL
ncbi:hypothetical protein EsH8_II_001581 [Colletotrichum jinshuiense]